MSIHLFIRLFVRFCMCVKNSLHILELCHKMLQCNACSAWYMIRVKICILVHTQIPLIREVRCSKAMYIETHLRSHSLTSVDYKQLCALAQLECTHKEGNS